MHFKYYICLTYWAISKNSFSSSDEPDNVFLTRPKVIQFTQYAVGIVYEVCALLQNDLTGSFHVQLKQPDKVIHIWFESPFLLFQSELSN